MRFKTTRAEIIIHQNTGTAMLMLTNAVMIPGVKTLHAMGALWGNMSTISFKMEISVCVWHSQGHHTNFINYYIISLKWPLAINLF